MATALSIAVLDDELHMRRALRRLLGTHGHFVKIFGTGRELLAALEIHRFDCLVLDLHMPVMNGFDVLQSLAALGARLPVIVITGQDQPGNAERVTAMGALSYLVKPLHETVLLEAITRCVAQTVSTAPSAPLNQGAISRL